MAVQIITIEDLNEFRNLLLNDLKEIINSKPQQSKQWLKSNDKQVVYERVIGAMAAANKAGIEKVGFVTDPGN